MPKTDAITAAIDLLKADSTDPDIKRSADTEEVNMDAPYGNSSMNGQCRSFCIHSLIVTQRTKLGLYEGLDLPKEDTQSS